MKRLRIIAILVAALIATGCSSVQVPQEISEDALSYSSQEEHETIVTSESDVTPSIVSDLYVDVFKPFCGGMDSLTFDEAKKKAQDTGYIVEITNSEGALTVSSDDGDIISAEFCWDMNGKNTLYQLMYTRGERFFYASSLAHIHEVQYYTNDSTTENQVNGLSECEQFLFDGSVSSSDGSYSVTLLYGTLLEKRVIGDSLTIKAKIEPSYNNKSTIDQNYYNVEDIIKKQGGTRFSHIDYWAVADMTDGSEKKVISFTLSSDSIEKVADNQIVANEMGLYVDNLFILPNLTE